MSDLIKNDNPRMSFQIGGNTAGVTSSVFSQSLIIAGGNNITISQNGSSFVVSAPSGATATGNLGAISAGTTQATNGTVIFSNSNGMSFGMDAGTITGSYTVPTVPSMISVGVSGGNTLGNTGVVSNQFVLAGGNNITLSGSTNGAGMSVTVSAFNQSVQTQGVAEYGMSNLGNTSGTTGTVDKRFIVVGGAGMVGSQSINGSSATLTLVNSWSTGTTASQVSNANAVGANAGRFAMEGHQHAGIAAFGASNTGNTAGNTGTQFGTWIIAGTNNITVSGSTGGAGVHTLWLSAPLGGAGGSNTLSVYRNINGSQSRNLNALVFNTLYVFPLQPDYNPFPGAMTANTMHIGMSGSMTATSQSSSHTYTVIGMLYTLANSTQLTMVNSFSTTWGVGASTANTSLYHGPRELTVHSSLWSSSPAFSGNHYWMGMIFRSSNFAAGALSISGARVQTSLFSGYIGVGNTNSTSSMNNPFLGYHATSQTTTVGSLATSQLRHVNALAGVIPSIMFRNGVGLNGA